MPDAKTLAQSEVENLSVEQMMEFLYGAIQSVIERNAPKNVAFHYFMPSIPFGPELGVFMDIGREGKSLDTEDESGEPRFTVNDMMRAAVNFAAIVDYIPVINTADATDADDGDVVSMNNLISSGQRVSTLYESILRTAKVVDNARTPEEEERLNALRAALYKEPLPEPEPEPGAEGEDDLLDGLEDDEDIDLAALMSDGAETADFVDDPDAIAEPTRPMQLYQALEAHYYQVQARELDKISQISPNDPNGGIKIKASKNRIRTALQRWEAQGRKTQIEGILARIEQLSQAGMVQYISDLRERLRGNEVLASVFSSEEGLGALTEEAYYTALRPNGILDVSGMSVTISNRETANWSRFERTRSSGSGFGIAGAVLLGGGGSELDEDRERAFFSEDFEISFEIVQGIVDRPWLDLGFIESPAYTTVDPETNEALDVVKQITTLSDGEVPPKDGLMPAVPVSVYFVKNLKVRSRAFSRLGESERDRFSGRGGISVFGFGMRGRHDNETVEASWSTDSTSGTIAMDGTFLIGMSSRFLKKAPNPDFEQFPDPDDWIGA
jgi:hypothetical protein